MSMNNGQRCQGARFVTQRAKHDYTVTPNYIAQHSIVRQSVLEHNHQVPCQIELPDGRQHQVVTV